MKNNKKIAFITGASRGIGKAIAKKFINENIQVIGTSTTKHGVDKINAYLKKKDLDVF